MAGRTARRLIEAARAAGIAVLVAAPLFGFQLAASGRATILTYRFSWIAYAALAVFLGRLSLSFFGIEKRARRQSFPASDARFLRNLINLLVILLAASLPWFSFADRNFLDSATRILIYVMLGTGLNIVVRLAGLLDLGYAAYFAIGAYSYGILSQRFGLSFWECLPISGLLATGFGLAVASPAIRSRGEYLAIVTLAFGEIVQTVLVNWTPMTGGVKGISGIPRASFFGLPFSANVPPGEKTFAQYFNLPFSAMHEFLFLYYLVLAMVLFAGAFVWRIRRLPLGRAWHALRVDEIAGRSLGFDPVAMKLCAFALGAGLAGFAGCVFAAQQGSVSPGDFTFIQTAMVLAIVLLGMKRQLGIALAAIVVAGIPEWFHEAAEYRMIAVGAALVLVMLWRLDGASIHRTPTIRLKRREIMKAEAQ